MVYKLLGDEELHQFYHLEENSRLLVNELIKKEIIDISIFACGKESFDKSIWISYYWNLLKIKKAYLLNNQFFNPFPLNDKDK